MSQIPISEYNCKSLLGEFRGVPYPGYSVTDWVLRDITEGQYVIKPDMKFGGRGKLGLVGVKLDKHHIQEYLKEFYHKEVVVSWTPLVLNQFIVESWVEHTQEYYLAMDTNNRWWDTIYYSDQWWVDIEHHRDDVLSVLVKTWDTLDTVIDTLTWDRQIQEFIRRVYEFFVSYGFAYLEFNPFVLKDGEFVILDAVAKIDTCESYRQKTHRGDYDLMGQQYDSEIEQMIASMDAQSWASIKFVLLNPQWSLWMILGGWGASVVMMDTLVERWYLPQIANYGELSWGPSAEENYLYTDLLIQHMCQSTAPVKYLMIVGGIANFTNILDQMKWVCQALDNHLTTLKAQNITLLIRRWGIQESQWLALIQSYCQHHDLSYQVFGGEMYLTEIIDYISL